MATRYDGSVPLGQGGYGSVFLGTYKGRKVAVKRVVVFRINDNEEKALKRLDHPNIVKLFYSEKDNNFKYFYLELCVASLDQVFLDPGHPKKYKGPPLPRYIDICRQLASGLAYIHTEQLIHRDIKPGNILISVGSPDQGERVTIKWADFGLSKSVNERGTCTMSDVRGTKNWYAPELLKLLFDNQETIEARCSVKSDVFALGLVFGYLFLGGKHPYGSNEFQITNNIIGEKMPEDVQGILIECCGDEILGLMLKVDPNERITSAEVVPKLTLMKDKLTEELNQSLLQNWDPTLKDERMGKIEHLRRLVFDVSARKMSEDDPQKRITSEKVVELPEFINHELPKKEEELRQLCANDSSPGLIQKIKELITLGIDVNAKDNDGFNALHILCRFNSNPNLMDVIKLFHDLGIDAKAQTNDRRNAVHLLCQNTSNPDLTGSLGFLLIISQVNVVSDGIDARSLIRDNEGILNKENILKMLDNGYGLQNNRYIRSRLIP